MAASSTIDRSIDDGTGFLLFGEPSVVVSNRMNE